jgi:diacylglycerol kinase (ATP)
MWALVINPVSGQGKGASVGSYVAGYLNKKSVPFTIVTGNSALALSNHLDIFLKANPQCVGVIAVGGDGLLHIVLQKVIPAQVPITLIPAGTGNDFVRSLGWDLNDVDVQLDFVLSHPPQKMDAGLVDGEWFGSVLSTGFDAVVNERANKLKWPKGPMKYNVSIVLELPRFKPKMYDIHLDDRTISTQAMLIAVGNGRSYGGGMLVCPEADMCDGFFDVMILHPVSKIEFIKVFPSVFIGAHVNHPAVEIVRSKKVRIDSKAVAYSDGERIGQLPVNAECIPGVMLGWTP